MTRASTPFASPIDGRVLIRAAWQYLTSPPSPDPLFTGSRVASVAFAQDGLGDGGMTVTGTLSLHRHRDDGYTVGIEMPSPVFGGLWAPVRRWSFSLDEVLEVRWEPGRWGGEVVLTAMTREGFADLPGAPRDRFPVRVGRRDRERAQAFAQAVALADLPA